MDAKLDIRRLSVRLGSVSGLFERASNGDPVAFAEIYRRYHPRIYGFCLARVMDREAAEDATQEVFLRLLQADSTTIDNPSAWMYGVARHVSADALRRRMRLAETGPVEEDSLAWNRLASADSADAVMGRETARNIFLTLRKLSARYRTALILRELHGQSSAEIAEALETTVGAANTLVSRARDAFGETYAEVSNLPPACADAVGLIYRDLGSGVNDTERERMEAHAKTCVRCRTESKRANNRRTIPGLLPMLLPARALGSIPQAVIDHPATANILLQQCTNMSWITHVAMTAFTFVMAGVVAFSGGDADRSNAFLLAHSQKVSVVREASLPLQSDVVPIAALSVGRVPALFVEPVAVPEPLVAGPVGPTGPPWGLSEFVRPRH